METIKIIQIDGINYELKATYDSSGNIINLTYAKSVDVPTKVSLLLNDENYLKEHLDISGLATKEELESKVSAADINTITVLTQTAYDELPLKDGTTLYLILEG